MIHQYKSNGYNIVMDINSGAIHVVDDVVYDIIELYEGHEKSEIMDMLASKYPKEDMEEAFEEGILKAIGVSNFYPDRFVDISNFVKVQPAVNQIETHPFQQQKQARKYLDKYHTQIESWGPFAQGRKDLFQNPVLQEVGAKYGKTVAQTVLRFLIQSGVVVIPKSTHKERMQENFNVFDFTLNEDDMQKIQALDEAESAFFSHYDPETVEFLASFGK